jgi:ABC-type nitrate/sulfonate/bicarbonate transport system ATPase subunit
LNDEQTDGGAGPLELRIDAKTFVSADGTSVEIVRGLNLRLEAGGFGAMIGPSGCGKTTILHIAAGLDADFAGQRRVPGARLGIVFQEPRLLPWRTVAENIRLVLPAQGSLDQGSLDQGSLDHGPPDDLADLIETLGLGSHLAHFPGELSLGLARRVAIARAFAVRPDFLLLDEPFVSLDEAVAGRLREEVAVLTERHRMTTLLVTHDLRDAVQLADRLFFLSARPASIVSETSLPPPRRMRSKQAIDRILEDLSTLPLGQSAT